MEVESGGVQTKNTLQKRATESTCERVTRKRGESKLEKSMINTHAFTTAVTIVDDPVLQDVAGQLAPRSRRMYKHGAPVFAFWIIERDLTPAQLTTSDMIAYRVYLAEHYKESTASNMLSVARRILEEMVDRKQIESNPATNVRGFKGEDETPHVALTGAKA